MNAEEIRRIVIEAAVDVDGEKRMPCAKAFVLAGEYSIPLREIGACCNQNDIKICRCQLGCFK
ncbi:MAG: hypothetical protein KAX38_09770 [Candidatus Krumholzibacteria bacterium]|nr:hypothetical protein [Candidatus Krumholzibacteria bacterium]